MIRPDGYVKILDFGLAKLVEHKAGGLEDAAAGRNDTAKGVILGTINYMSPEQAKGEKVDARTDIFSFGVMFYEMIAGRTPFAGDSKSEAFANLINAEPPPLATFSPDAPEELQRIVAKALRKNRGERYQSMKDLLSDLKDLRENLAFGERLKKSPSQNDKNTFALPATTAGGASPANEGNNNFTGRIKRHKPFAALVLAVLLLSAIGIGYYAYNAKKSTSNPNAVKTLAVLPFVNAGQDKDADYLSDGITESIINNLSQLSGIKVMSRNSAFRFKNDQTDAKNIAAQLGVETLVTGDIKQLGDKLIINVRLIDARDDSQIWGNQYVKSSADLIAAQNEIAQAVATSLRVKLTASEQQQLAKHPTENVEAFQLYQRGRFHVFKVTPSEIQKGIGYFQQAIELDPNYARAYAGLADAYRSLAVGSEMSPTEFFPKSKTAALKALELDDTLAEGHATLGMTLFWGEWNWREAENHFKRAIELDPNNTSGHLLYAHLLSNMGRHAEALSEVKRARELDPLFAFAGALEGQFLNHAGRPDEALDRLQKTLELAPNFWMPHIFASSVYIEKGMYSEAAAEARKAKELSPAQTVSEAFGGYALAKSGKTDEARAVLNELLKLSETRFVPAHHLALIYNGLGEIDKTFEWLEKAYRQHDPKMNFLKVEPKWNNLRADPRFRELVRRLDFPE
jgi:eukaryotic-like serine/threonine-protein kinase